MRHGAAGRLRRAGRVGATWTPRGYDTACAQRYGHVAHPPLTGRRRSDSGPPPACARTDKSADTLWATGAGLSAVGGRSYPSGRGGLQEPCHAGLGSELYQLVCNVNTNGQYGNKHGCVRACACEHTGIDFLPCARATAPRERRARCRPDRGLYTPLSHGGSRAPGRAVGPRLGHGEHGGDGAFTAQGSV